MKIVAVSGGFDPLHIGHIQHFQAAKALGDKLVVIVNNDEWLLNKKGRKLMSLEDRVYIINSLSVVDGVIVANKPVADVLRDIRPDIFANGGDRIQGNVPEEEVCKELGIEMRYGVQGVIRSSSELLQDYGT